MLGTLALANTPTGGYHLLKKIPLCAAPGGKKYFDYITLRQKPR